MKIISAFVALIALSVLGCNPSSQPEDLHVRTLEYGIKDHFQVEGNPEGVDSLYPISPNPFSRGSGDSTISITFSLKDTATAIVLIQNPIGDEVIRFREEKLTAGTFKGHWDPIASDGVPLNSGMYFVTLNIGSRNYINSRLLYIQNNN